MKLWLQIAVRVILRAGLYALLGGVLLASVSVFCAALLTAILAGFDPNVEVIILIGSEVAVYGGVFGCLLYFILSFWASASDSLALFRSLLWPVSVGTVAGICAGLSVLIAVEWQPFLKILVPRLGQGALLVPLCGLCLGSLAGAFWGLRVNDAKRTAI